MTWNRVAGIPYAATRRRFASACCISDSPVQDKSVEQPWAMPGISAAGDGAPKAPVELLSRLHLLRLRPDPSSCLVEDFSFRVAYLIAQYQEFLHAAHYLIPGKIAKLPWSRRGNTVQPF